MYLIDPCCGFKNAFSLFQLEFNLYTFFKADLPNMSDSKLKFILLKTWQNYKVFLNITTFYFNFQFKVINKEKLIIYELKLFNHLT